MKLIFKPGDQKKFSKIVEAADTAGFESGLVHEVYSTFSIARDAEWSGRLFVLEIREDDEEGIGTFITVHHHAPAFPGEMIIFTATLTAIRKHEIITSFEARAGKRLIASGEQGQKLFKLEKIKRLLTNTR
ncbi:MAG: hypothetical protein K1X61_05815 [Chitinophagales bacterium]|nr:hypothetical protein [Chitinophagales bacterium]